MRVADPRHRIVADDPVWDDPARHHSAWLIALSDGVDAVLVGALEGDTPRLHADRDVVAAWTETSRPGTWVVLRGQEASVFDRYRDLLGQRYGIRAGDPGNVWCSWYSHFAEVTEEDITSALPGLRELGFDVVQLDDGWQLGIGDWEANEKFPGGMQRLAATIQEHGMRPGLWVAPFAHRPGTATYERVEHLLLRDASGRPVVVGHNWGGEYHSLDYTRPEAVEELRRLVRTVVDWGWTYLKLDFLESGAAPGCRARDIDREAAYRLALAEIRNEVGEEVFILASGALIMPSLGIVDAVRTGPDVAMTWANWATEDLSCPGARNALRGAVERLWLRGLVGIDPDVVFFRHRNNLLTDQEMALLRDCAQLSGFRATSDALAWLTAEERAELARWFGRSPVTRRLGRHRHEIDGREVDFAPSLGLELG